MNNLKSAFDSLQETGGASYNFSTGILNPTSGWMVSITDHEQKYPIPKDYIEFGKLITDYLYKNFESVGTRLDILFNEPTLYLGLWINKDDNLLYVDISECYEWFTEAVHFGMKYKQLAIYDCANKREFKISYPA